jgi:hypothetical protein
MENRLRHYERLPRYLEGFLVMGDGVAKLNPTHAQGMTVAAMGSQVLDHTLQAHRNRQPTGDLTGLARAFQTELVQVVGIAWNMATSTDRRWPKAVAAEQKLGFKAKLRQKYLRLVLQAVVHNPIVAETFFQVQHMVAPGTELFRPRIIFQVLASKLWPRRSTRVTHAGEPATYP